MKCKLNYATLKNLHAQALFMCDVYRNNEIDTEYVRYVKLAAWIKGKIDKCKKVNRLIAA
jgi:hypothetical protein